MYSPSRPTSTSPGTPSLRPSHGQTLTQQQQQQPLTQAPVQTQGHLTQAEAQASVSHTAVSTQGQLAALAPGATTSESVRPQASQLSEPQLLTLQPAPILNSINRVSRTYYSKKDQDTIYYARNPGISLHRQADMRREACEVIAAIGKKIGFPQRTISTAQLLLHRFFMFNSVPDTGNEVVMACLFVSSKVEDTIKKLKDIMVATFIYRHSDATDWDPESREGEEQRKRVLSYEKMVLESICFDFRIVHPYKYVIKFVKIMGGSQNLARKAWDIARNSYKVGVCLEYPPHTIAAGSIYLAAKLIGESFPDLVQGVPWMKAFRTRSIDVDDFSHQMLDLLSIGRSDAQRQQYDTIHISLNDAHRLDLEHQMPKLKKARIDFATSIGVQA
ncbi:hypothetical protein BX616_001154, partial [Lobosporangium transversale]